MRVLIVDDHPIIVSGCAAMLAGEGDIEVVDARDAETGLAVFVAHRPDVTVVDIACPAFPASNWRAASCVDDAGRASSSSA